MNANMLTENQGTHKLLTWSAASLLVSQLTAAVRATCIDAPFTQQENRVVSPAGNILQPPSIEHFTAPRLENGAHRVS